MSPGPTQAFDYRSNCVHCGLCLPVCPTYAELGDENDSPRGRIYLMQAIEEGRLQPSPATQRHLDLCLDCRACETVCPSGVAYGQMIESHRAAVDGTPFRRLTLADRVARRLLLNVLPDVRRTRWLLWAARLAHATGLAAFLQSTGLLRGQAAALKFPEILDRFPPAAGAVPARTEPEDRPTVGAVGLFRGCVSESVLGHTNRATCRVLLRNRLTVHCPPQQLCCGAIHFHAGQVNRAAALARANIRAFEECGSDLQAVVSNVAGCGLMLKHYGALLRDDASFGARAEAFSSKVQDIQEFLSALPFEKPTRSVALRVTYHEACHLCHGQGVRRQPRLILQSIPGLELLELAEADWCCGAAGSYSLTQPHMAGRLAARKLQRIAETGSQVVAAANAGCILHLRQHVALKGRDLFVVHPVDLLDIAYGHPPDDHGLAILQPAATLTR